MIELVKFMVTSLVENKDEVVIVEEPEGTIKVTVAKSDMGKVIGRQGKIAKAIRSVVKAAATDKKYNVEIVDVK